jgi:hypothetical protein
MKYKFFDINGLESDKSVVSRMVGNGRRSIQRRRQWQQGGGGRRAGQRHLQDARRAQQGQRLYPTYSSTLLLFYSSTLLLFYSSIRPRSIVIIMNMELNVSLL